MRGKDRFEDLVAERRVILMFMIEICNVELVTGLRLFKVVVGYCG
jgi:hypothetical protein